MVVCSALASAKPLRGVVRILSKFDWNYVSVYGFEIGSCIAFPSLIPFFLGLHVVIAFIDYWMHVDITPEYDYDWTKSLVYQGGTKYE